GHYRKRHPWYPETWATPGDLGHPVVITGGLVFTFAVCFDVHFVAPDLPAADWLIFPSAWVEDGVEQPEPLLRALAVSRGLGVVSANWGRGEPAMATQGRSLIIAATGEVVAETSRAAQLPLYQAHSATARRSSVQ